MGGDSSPLCDDLVVRNAQRSGRSSQPGSGFPLATVLVVLTLLLAVFFFSRAASLVPLGFMTWCTPEVLQDEFHLDESAVRELQPSEIQPMTATCSRAAEPVVVQAAVSLGGLVVLGIATVVVLMRRRRRRRATLADSSPPPDPGLA